MEELVFILREEKKGEEPCNTLNAKIANNDIGLAKESSTTTNGLHIVWSLDLE